MLSHVGDDPVDTGGLDTDNSRQFSRPCGLCQRVLTFMEWNGTILSKMECDLVGPTLRLKSNESCCRSISAGPMATTSTKHNTLYYYSHSCLLATPRAGPHDCVGFSGECTEVRGTSRCTMMCCFVGVG